MNFDLNVCDALSILPLCREEIFSEVVHSQIYGHIYHIWQHPGHLFIAVNDGHRLFTFDCKPVTQQHAFDSGNLDISSLPSPINNIFMTSDDTVAIVCNSGHIYPCKFEKDSSWTRLTDYDLCSAPGSEVLSVSYSTSAKCLVWCEKLLTSASSQKADVQSAVPYVYRICKQILNAGSEVDVILYNCPPFEIDALTEDLLFFTSRYDKDQVTVHAVYNCKNHSLNLYIGEKNIEKPLSSYLFATDFQEMAKSCLSNLVKCKTGTGDLGVRADCFNKKVVVFSSTGELECFSCVKEKGDTCSWKVRKKTYNLSQHINKFLRVEKCQWFFSRGCLGFIYQEKIYIIELNGNTMSCARDELQETQIAVPSHSPAFLAWILTSSGLWSLQSSEKKNNKQEMLKGNLSEEHMISTDIIHLANLHEKKLTEYESKVVSELNYLKENWSKKGLSHSQLAQSVEPYLNEYWKLESISDSLLDIKRPLQEDKDSITKTFIKDFMQSNGDSRAMKHAKLVWLSQIEPRLLLEFLCQGITIQNEEVKESELIKWQTLLGLEGGDMTNFEFVCRLLFLLHPEKLFPFVKCAESASEQSVGVSAFVRKKHSLVFYKAACDCLPETKFSSNPKEAQLAKTKLILASGTDHCVEQALKQLLQYSMWEEAISLLQDEVDNKEMLPTFLFTTLKAMTQGQVLQNYVKDLLSIMPTWKSFISFADIASQNEEIHRQQLSMSAENVFASDSTGIPFHQVKSHLVDLINKMEIQK